MKAKSQLRKLLLTATIISFVAAFFILATETESGIDQPLVTGGSHHSVGLKSDGAFIAETHMNRKTSFRV